MSTPPTYQQRTEYSSDNRLTWEWCGDGTEWREQPWPVLDDAAVRAAWEAYVGDWHACDLEADRPVPYRLATYRSDEAGCHLIDEREIPLLQPTAVGTTITTTTTTIQEDHRP